MYSIENNVENTIEIKKSKFICKLYKINNLEELKIILNNLDKNYNDATHICYAYILNGMEKCSDNGEPSGTAGIPILNVLKKNKIENVLCVVIRYFGGIKLGAGGLVRAYSNSVSECLKLTSIVELIEGYLIELEFCYDQLKLIDYMLNDKEIISKDFKENIIYKFYLLKEELNFIPEFEKVSIHVSVMDKVMIKKST